jgi:general L-amino acid transport system substrate-binding protein
MVRDRGLGDVCPPTRRIAGDALPAAGLTSLAVEGRDLGLPDDWAKRVVGAAGSYADIYARNLGEGSPLKLPRGPNAPTELGGLFVTPYRE